MKSINLLIVTLCFLSSGVAMAKTYSENSNGVCRCGLDKVACSDSNKKACLAEGKKWIQDATVQTQSQSKAQ